MTICCSFKITISALFKIFSSDVIFKKAFWETYIRDSADLRMPSWVLAYAHQLDV